MCGRYYDNHEEFWPTLFAFVYGENWRQKLQQETERLTPRWNIAPSQKARQGGEVELAEQHWGLLPVWAKDRKFAYRTFNARSETAHEKPSFRAAFKKRRCLVPAAGYYEWQKTGPKSKQAYAIELTGDRPMLFYGLWESWPGPKGDPLEEPLETFTILTTSANEATSMIHDRMPCICAGESDAATWLDAEFQDSEHLRSLLSPYPAEEIAATAVSDYVNNAKHEGPKCLEPIE